MKKPIDPRSTRTRKLIMYTFINLSMKNDL